MAFITKQFRTLFKLGNALQCSKAPYCAMMKEQTVTIKGQTINFVKTGNGNKTLLCFPGALGTIWSDFKPQIEKLNKNKFVVVAFDPPGYGLSRPPKRNFSLDFYEKDADMAYDFMKEIGEDKYSLLGWSDGGISSMILSSKYPDAVEKLIVWGSNAYVIPAELQSYEKIRNISKWSDKMKAPLIKLYTEEGLQEMWSGWCDALQKIYKSNGGNLCKQHLPNIKCPTLIVHGNKDPMVAPEHPDYLVNNIKGAKLIRFAEGKHNLHLRYADEFNKLVTDFLLNHKLQFSNL